MRPMQAKPINLNRLAYFAAVLDTGSFTRAAERLGITKAVVSQQVARLERDLGTSLLVRTTRSLHPTEAGRTLHARCVTMLREAEAAFDELAQEASEPTGILRITAPNDYGTAIVAAVASAFTTRFPACRVELTLADEAVDLVSTHMDVAIRVGWLVDSSLQARRIASFRQFLVAAPILVERIADIPDPSGLAALPFVANMALNDPLLWQFSHQDLNPCRVKVQASIAVDTTPGVLAAVLAGGGLSVLPDFLVAEDLASGRLINVLPEWQLPSGGIHIVFPAARFRPPKVTAFVEMLVAAQRDTT